MLTQCEIKSFPLDRITNIQWADDGTWTCYLGPIVLSDGDTREEAESYARYVIAAVRDGVQSVIDKYPMLPAALERIDRPTWTSVTA